jgi:hypothetical protein
MYLEPVYYLVLNRKVMATSVNYQYIKVAQTEMGGEVMKFTPARLGTELSDTFINMMEVM